MNDLALNQPVSESVNDSATHDASPHDPTHELVLERKEAIADGVVRLTLRDPAGRPVPAWEPGAHVDLLLADDVVRQYSLCSDPRDRSALQVAVLREDGGRGGSHHVHDTLAEGRPVRVRGPRNHFPLTEEAGRYLFVAGGIGITPLRPMIDRVAALGRDWRLLYGGRTRASMAFRDELAARYPGHVDLRPQDEYGLLDLAPLLADPGPDADGTAVYCCGPEPLLQAVEAHCAAAWPAGTLHVERFAPKPGAAEGPREAFEVELARSGRTLTVPAGRSVLETVEEAGVPVLSSCQEGTCGTCETGVLSGTPDHRDSVLTEEEKAAEDTMMICVSRSRSPRLVLDL